MAYTTLKNIYITYFQ